MIKNPNRAYKERRFERIFGNIDSAPSNYVVDCYIRIEKRRIDAKCVFNEYVMYLQQKSTPLVYDANYFRVFWNSIVEIKAQMNNSYLIELTLRDMRKIYVEFRKDDAVRVNQRLSNSLRFHNEAPSMLEMVTELHKARYGTELVEVQPSDSEHIISCLLYTSPSPRDS